MDPLNETKEAPSESAQAPSLPIYLDARRKFAESYLFGEGLEIGPLHQPLPMPPHVTVRYVDRMSDDELRREYPELADWDLTPVDIVDDGEALSTIAEESQDFIVANHFLEHCENPIGTIEAHLGKLRPAGILFYAVPDKRFTFDYQRQVTPLQHMIDDYKGDHEQSRRDHYDDWTRLVVNEQLGEPAVKRGRPETFEELAERRAREMEAAKYSIHMHVWTQGEFLELILDCRRRFAESIDIEAAAKQGIEFMVVLRKRGPLPDPIPIPPPAPPPPPPMELSEVIERNKLIARTRRALGTARREFRKIDLPE
jgi:hypothetical protein